MGKKRFIALSAKISGEMKVEDIPTASWANVDELKKGDDDPLEVVMSVPSGKSTRGWNYTVDALNSIVGEVNTVGLPGFLGHQKAEDVPTDFPNPVTHWIGAKMQDGVAYFRGLIDKSAPDLKRWIRGKAISQVSIYGYPQLQQNAVTGETDVTDYKGLSIDWTPLNRAGMPTSIAALSGEMDSVITPTDASHEELRDALHSAAYDKLVLSEEDYLGIAAVYDDHFIAVHNNCSANGKTRYYKILYTKSPEGNILLGEVTEVIHRDSWEPVTSGEQKGIDMKKEEKDLLDAGNKKQPPEGNSRFEQVCGEMFDGKTGDALMEAIKAAAELSRQAKENNLKALIDKSVRAKVSGEMAQSLIKKLLHVSDGATEEQICGEIDSVLADDTIKAILAQAHIDNVPPTSNPNEDAGSGLFTKTMTTL